MAMCHIVCIVAVTGVDHTDFAIFHYSGAKSLQLDGSPYTHVPTHEDFEARRYPYPPLLAMLILPLSWFDVRTATYIWFGIDFLLTGVIAWQLTAILLPADSTLARQRVHGFVVILGLLMCYTPQIVGNKLCQVHNLLAVTVLGSFLSLRAGKQVQAGLLLSVATLIKGFPGLVILGMFFSQRSRRAAIVATTSCLLFSLVFWQYHQQYITNHLEKSIVPNALACEIYVSAPAMASRIFVPPPQHSRLAVYSIPIIESPFLYSCAITGIALVVGVSLVILVWRKTREDVLFAAFLSASTILTPPFGYYHLNLAVIAAAICFRRLAENASSQLGILGTEARSRWLSNGVAFRTLVGCLLLTLIPLPWWIYPNVGPQWMDSIIGLLYTKWGLFFLTPSTYGMGGIFFICLSFIGPPKFVAGGDRPP